MEFGRLLNRSFELVRRHPVLWIYGIVLAILGAGGGNNINYQLNDRNTNFPQQPGQQNLPSIPITVEQVLPFVILIAVVALVIAVAFSLLRAIFDGGLIALADAADAGEPVSFGRGWHSGVSTMWRIWLIDLILAIPVIVLAVGFAISIITTVLSAVAANQENIRIVFILGVLAQILPAILCMTVVSVFLGIFAKIAKRIGVLENQSWSESIRSAWTLITHNLANTVVNWLIFGLINTVAGFVLALPVAGIVGGAIAAAIVNQDRIVPVIGGTIVLLFIYLIAAAIAGGMLLSFYWTGWTLFVKWTLHPPMPVHVPAPGPIPPGIQQPQP